MTETDSAPSARELVANFPYSEKLPPEIYEEFVRLTADAISEGWPVPALRRYLVSEGVLRDLTATFAGLPVYAPCRYHRIHAYRGGLCHVCNPGAPSIF
jgi:hypothetical protein